MYLVLINFENITIQSTLLSQPSSPESVVLLRLFYASYITMYIFRLVTQYYTIKLGYC